MCKELKTETIESLVIILNKEDNSDDILPSLQRLWTDLEEYFKLGKLTSIGVSDIETEKFIQLYNWANVSSKLSLSTSDSTLFYNMTKFSFRTINFR